MLEPGVTLDDQRRAALVSAVRARFEASGTVVAEWARLHGFNENMVHQVLAGRGKWKRGETHRIAVALGLKQEAPPPGVVTRSAPTPSPLGDLEPAR